ncbi:MAG: zinc ribbon domain-containing protein [Desulfobacteraceae bacterium]|nr:MAG: zinc ribbon domain-containing protein [Desulfobacteraceae bacterium]
MPIHEYECDKCRYRFEKLVLAGNDIPAECPECGSKKLKKLISGASIIGEGSGSACSSISPRSFS